MDNFKVQILNLDDEFLRLVQPFSEKTLKLLEETIFDTGCNKSLAVWNGILLFDKEIYEICHKRQIPFRIVTYSFKERSDAISFICTEQLKRTDLTIEYKRYLVGKRHQAESEINARDFVLNSSSFVNGNNPHSPQKPSNKYETARTIGSDLGYAANTVLKYNTYAKAIDAVFHKESAIALKILLGTLKVSHDNIIELARLPREDIKNINQVIAENNLAHISYSEIRHELEWRRSPISNSIASPNKLKEIINLDIRKMPKYDPDTEISSLSLTIPSWISSIERGMKHTDFSKISEQARKRILKQLTAMEKAVNNLRTNLEEATPNG